AADAVFTKRREETEDAPDDWRTWFRLAVAYQDARDTPRARKAMQRAIALHKSRPTAPSSPSAPSSRAAASTPTVPTSPPGEPAPSSPAAPSSPSGA
ncbi:tetratricopeptide repeat protein, partial [Streptomyces sp. SID7982]|nr:tetratricopeptide repeat protein [Streptomyces sp. SID7982]